MAHPTWPNPPDAKWATYWVYNDRCICPWRHGYVGVDKFGSKRFEYQHKKRFADRGPLIIRVLFTGSETECYALEGAMRPHVNIGWNIAAGGGPVVNGIGQMKGVPKTPEWRAKMKVSAKRRSETPEGRVRLLAMSKMGVAARGDQSGANNPMFGRSHSPNTLLKMSLVKRGKRPARYRTNDQPKLDL